MKHFFRILLICSLTVPGTRELAAQFLPIGLNGETRFVRQQDAMQWNLGGGVVRKGDNYRVSLNNRFSSRLYMTGGSARNIQDENTARLNAVRWFTPNLGAATEVRSYSFTTTDVRQNIAFGGVAIRPVESMEIRALTGIMSDRRSNIEDQGMAFSLQGTMDPFRLGDFSISPEFYSERAMITPRSYSNIRFQTGALYRQDDIELQGHLRMGQSTREGYQPGSFFNRDVSDIIESIATDTTELNLSVGFPIAGVLYGRLNIRALNNDRRIENRLMRDDLNTTLYDSETRRQELNIRYETEYPLRSQAITLGFEYAYINRESRLINTDDIPSEQVTRQNEILGNSNFNQSRFDLFTNSTISLSDRNTLITRGRIGIMHYDTPELNRDDRDELTYYVQIGNRHRFSEYLQGQIIATGEASHYVYLHSERSIENNWRRSIRLAPSISWDPGQRLSIRQQFLVRANYTVEDYEIEGRQKNDRSSREFGFQTEADFILNTDWSLELRSSRSELRIGRLYWDSFQEIPMDTLITYDNRLMIIRNYDRIRVAAGGRYFLRFDHMLQTSLSTNITSPTGQTQAISRRGPGLQTTHQFGPSVEISLPFVSGNRLYINGWLRKQMVRKQLYINYPEDVAGAFAAEESRYRTRLIPNVEIRANFSF